MAVLHQDVRAKTKLAGLSRRLPVQHALGIGRALVHVVAPLLSTEVHGRIARIIVLGRLHLPGIVGAQLHFHRYTDETFIVTAGTLAVQHGQTRVDAPAGSVIYVPRFTPHGFANSPDRPVTLNLIFNPAQKREGFFFGLEKILNATPVNPREFLALYHKYDSFPVDPANLLPGRKPVT
jgi:mannose-6-phosphate isomerase-like protein (cupin superfamily)